jgi:hypothetical protein
MCRQRPKQLGAAEHEIRTSPYGEVFLLHLTNGKPTLPVGKEEPVIAARLRECLKALRWEAADLAEELGCPESKVATWLDGRAPAPLVVGAWIESLVKAHKALPAPGRGVRHASGPAPSKGGGSHATRAL